jgi:hypothetical protein
MTVTLTPTTRRGKNRIARVADALPEWNRTWRIVRSCDRVNFARGEPGPWHLLEPVTDAADAHRFWFWCSATGDRNFVLQPNARNQATEPRKR